MQRYFYWYASKVSKILNSSIIGMYLHFLRYFLNSWKKYFESIKKLELRVLGCYLFRVKVTNTSLKNSTNTINDSNLICLNKEQVFKDFVKLSPFNHLIFEKLSNKPCRNHAFLIFISLDWRDEIVDNVIDDKLTYSFVIEFIQKKCVIIIANKIILKNFL